MSFIPIGNDTYMVTGMKRSALTGRYVTQNNGVISVPPIGDTPVYAKVLQTSKLSFRARFDLEFKYRVLTNTQIVGVIND